MAIFSPFQIVHPIGWTVRKARGTSNRAFLNKPADVATGLDIIGARQYDPATGRFTSADPLLNTGSPQQLNGYSYAEDNPVTDADPPACSTATSGAPAG